jgi:DNA-binding CsgD family transcriptional regulator
MNTLELRVKLEEAGLTVRQTEVVLLVAQGLSNKEVGNQLFIAPKTVKFHLTTVYGLLGVKSRAQLIVWCVPHLYTPIIRIEEAV